MTHPLEGFATDWILLVPELLQGATGGETLQIVQGAPDAVGRHIVQQGGETDRAVDGDDPF
ncbi:hypothetical protein D3C72_2320680 [compost metagenome]